MKTIFKKKTQFLSTKNNKIKLFKDDMTEFELSCHKSDWWGKIRATYPMSDFTPEEFTNIFIYGTQNGDCGFSGTIGFSGTSGFHGTGGSSGASNIYGTGGSSHYNRYHGSSGSSGFYNTSTHRGTSGFHGHNGTNLFVGTPPIFSSLSNLPPIIVNSQPTVTLSPSQTTNGSNNVIITDIDNRPKSEKWWVKLLKS